MAKPLYKNAIRSKKMIKSAFLELIQTKDISQIRIKEVIELSDISKGTFYAHYQDIYAVYEEIETESIESLVTYLNQIPNELLLNDFNPFLDQLFSYIDTNKAFYLKLFASPLAFTFLNKLQQVFVSYMMSKAELVNQFDNEIIAKQFFSFIAVGTASLIRDYYLEGSDLPLDEVKKNLNLSILYGLHAIIKK